MLFSGNYNLFEDSKSPEKSAPVDNGRNDDRYNGNHDKDRNPHKHSSKYNRHSKTRSCRAHYEISDDNNCGTSLSRLWLSKRYILKLSLNWFFPKVPNRALADACWYSQFQWSNFLESS